MDRSTSVDNPGKVTREQLTASIMAARKAVEDEHKKAWKMMKTLAKMKKEHPTK